MDCTAHLEAFGIGFGAGLRLLFSVALVVFVFGYFLPRLLNKLDRIYFKPVTVEQLEHNQRRVNANYAVWIEEAKKREGI